MSIPGIRMTESVVYSQSTLNSQQLKQLVYKLFDYFDQNKTGKLDSQQITNLLTFCVKNGVLKSATNNLYLQFMPKISKNRHGLVSKEQIFQFFIKNISSNVSLNSLSLKLAQVHHIKVSAQYIKINKGKLKNIGSFSEDQLRSLVQQAFLKYDLNKTGQMDYKELTNYLKNEWGGQLTYFQFIQKYDLDKTGLINKTQLYNFLRKINQAGGKTN